MIDEELVRLIRATIQDELRTAKLKVPEIAGAGGNTIISSRGDIVLSPGIGRHAYYQKSSGRVEIGDATATSLTGDFLPLGGGAMTGDITHNLASGDKYYNSAEGAIVAGSIRAFHGENYYDFLIETNGVMYLESAGGLSVQGSIIPNIDNAFTLGLSGNRWANLHVIDIVADSITLIGGSPGEGKVLTSNSAGGAHWGAAGLSNPLAATFLPSVTDTYGIGSSSYKWANLHVIDIVADSITLIGGSPGEGKVLTSNAGGGGSWQTPTGITNPLTSRLTLKVNGYTGTAAYLENDVAGVTTLGTKTKLKIVVT